MPVLKYENNVLTFICGFCKREDVEDFTDTEIQWNEEFQEFYPLAATCSHCEAEGRETIEFVNVNIPELDEMEPEVMTVLAPPEEQQARRAIRDIQWQKRQDLKDLDREKEREKFLNANQNLVEYKEGKIERIKPKGVDENKEAVEQAQAEAREQLLAEKEAEKLAKEADKARKKAAEDAAKQAAKEAEEKAKTDGTQ